MQKDIQNHIERSSSGADDKVHTFEDSFYNNYYSHMDKHEYFKFQE